MLIVLVEDDVRAREFVVKSLYPERHEIVCFENALTALDYLRTHPAVDVFLLDYQLPGGPTGLSLARQARQLFPASVIIMMSSYADKEDIIEAMQINTDDFILKPIEPAKLIQRVGDAVLKRAMWFPSALMTQQLGALKLDLSTRQVYWHDEKLHLTPVEFSLLSQLTAKPGRVFNYAELYSLSRGEHLPPNEARERLKSHITNLKRKFALLGSRSIPVRTVRGFGFQWNESDDSEVIQDDDQEL